MEVRWLTVYRKDLFMELAALIAVLVVAGSMIPGNPGIVYYR
jgi:hypothetical protein